VTRYSIGHLRSLSREYDLFEPAARDWSGLVEEGFHPPLAVTGTALVWGFALLDAAEKAGRPDLPCREAQAREPADLLTLALRLENRRGRYAWPEQSGVYRFLTGSVHRERWQAVIPLITADQPLRWLTRMQEYTTCPALLRRLVDSDLLDLKTAAKTRELPGSFFAALAERPDRFSFSERRLLALSLREVLRRDRLAPDGAAAFCLGLLDQADPLEVLRASRFPQLTGLLQRLEAMTGPLAGQGVAVTPPADFEGEAFTFSFSATSRAVYARKTAALKAFEDEVDRLFDLL
jgi:hypothetical protein